VDDLLPLILKENKREQMIEIPDYMSFVEKQTRDAAFYYSPTWLNLITSLYGHRIIPLHSTNREGQITGILPLCSIQSPLTGRRLVALPYSDYYPFLAVDDEATHKLITEAIDLARDQKARYLELRAGSSEVLDRCTDLVKADLCVRPLLSLSEDRDVAWSRLHKSVRQEVRKAQKQGVQVRVAQRREDVAYYYRLHVQTYCQKHGVLSQPAQFFYDLWDCFAANNTLQLLLAEYEGQIIAGTILLASGNKTLKYAYGASDRRYLHLAANRLLLWNAVVWGCEQGYQILDMGSTARQNEGLMQFKLRWGAVPEPLPYYYYPAMAAPTGTSSGRSQTRHFLRECWKRLPIMITGPVSGSLYRHMA
jgi:CelD/BcsL family acetyltransferase involved in cellulose biosynthesis